MIGHHPEIDAIANVKNNLLINDTELASLLNISSSDLRKTMAHDRKLKFKELFSLAENLNVDVENLVSGNINFDNMKLFYQKGLARLDEKYTKIAAYSKIQSIKSILYYIQLTYTDCSPLIHHYFRHFQVNEELLNEKNKAVNLKFIMDSTNFLSRYVDLDYYKIGQFSCVNLATKPFVEKLKLMKNKPLHKLYEYFFDELIVHFEKNFDYRISKSGHNELYFSVTPKESVSSEVNEKIIDDDSVNNYRLGVISALPTLIGELATETFQINDVSEKDPVYRYRIVM